MSYKIVVDLSHKEKIEEFPEFSLTEEVYEVEYIDKNEGPIDFDILEDYDILTSGDGGDRDISMKQGSIRVLYKITGVRRFWNGIIQEASSNFLVKKRNLLVTELFNHPITEGITELVLPNSTFFTISEEDVDDIIITSEKSEFKYYADDELGALGPVPVCAVSGFYEGRCVTIGSSDWLTEDGDFGLDSGDNLKFLTNIIEWLSFEV